MILILDCCGLIIHYKHFRKQPPLPKGRLFPARTQPLEYILQAPITLHQVADDV
jgi:hypothetical protein